MDTKIPESELNDAERKVLDAFRARESTVSVASAEIRGDFLRGLFLGEYNENADYRGTRIVGARIDDEFNMEFCETKFPVRFRNCYFSQEVKLQQLACPMLEFRGCTLENEIDAKDAKIAGTVFLNDGFEAGGEVNLLRAYIGGQLDCTGGIFQSEGGDALRAQHIKVADSVFLRAEFNGAVNLVGADIEGQLNCKGGNFQNAGEIALNAQDARVVANVFLDENFVAAGAVWLAGADIKRQLACAGGSFRNEDGYAINAQGIKVGEIAFLSDGFEAEGETSLLGAEIGGQLNCGGGSFQNEGGYALNAQNIKVAETVFLSDEFNARGAVSLVGAEIGGQINCRDGSFHNDGGDALNAHSVKVADAVFLHNGFESEGKVIFLGADIGGQFSCKGGSFQNEGSEALVAHGIKVGSDVLLDSYKIKGKGERKFSADGLVLFTNATIGGSFLLKGCQLAHLSLSGANVMGEFEDDADAYKLDKDNRIDLNIDGFRYHRLGDVKERVKDRLEWVGLMSEGEDFYPQPYEQLMQVYRATGHTNWARRVGFELERKRHKQLRLNRDHRRFVVLGWAWWFWYWVLRGTIGYGYKPFRAVTHWFTPLIVAGFLLFNGTLSCSDPCRAESDACHCMAPSDAGVLLSDDWKIHGNLPKDYPDFNPVYYAVEAALPVLPLGQTENWHPKSRLVRWAQGAITFIGALVLTILASYGVGVLGPRWKNE